MKTWEFVLLAGGILIIVLAVLDMMNVPLEFPTSSNGTNLAIGAGLAAAPFLYRKVA
jgi:hypothetical protein